MIEVRFLVLFFFAFVYGQVELPEYDANEIIIKNKGFTLSFNESHRQSNWVAYELTRAETMGTSPRTNYFLVDPKLLGLCALPTDYKGTDYDRGHLAPAADMAWSKVTMKESFYMSNISPQYYSLNRGAWKKLEKLVRRWASEYGSIYIVTAGILIDDLNKIGGKNDISVPENYYKVILDYNEPDLKAIGFILPNKKINQPLQNFVFTVDHIEELTGINFFHSLPDDVEEDLESKSDLNSWIWD